MAFPVLGQPHPTYTDPNGDPYSSGTLTFTEPSDGSPKSTYPTAVDADAASNANPTTMTLNQRGSTANGTGVWGIDGEEYDVVLKDVNGTVVWTAEDVAWDQGNVASTKVHIARTQAEEDASIGVYDPDTLTMGDIVQPWLEPGDVDRYGVNTTPGTTDMCLALRSAILQNEQSTGAPIVTGQTTYYISQTLEWCAAAESDKVWYSSGSIITTLGNDVDALKIGPLTYDGRANRIRILGNLRVTNTVGLPTVTAAGITIQQCGASTFNIEADEWYYGIKLTADTAGRGCARNTIFLGEIHENYYGVALIVDGTNSFVNDNDFHGGYFSFQNSHDIGYHIYIPFNTSGTSDSGKQPNHNTFYQPRLEGGATGTALGAYYDAGNYNNLIMPRTEIKSDALSTEQQIFYTEDSSNNYLLFGWATKANVTSSANNEVDDQGTDNIIITSDTIRFRSGGTGNGGEVAEFQRSKNNGDDLPAVVIRDMWDGTTAENAMAIKTAVRQTNSGGYHLSCETMGDIVWRETANGVVRCYECIQAHTPATGATSGPGTGSSWTSYWRDLHSKYACGGTPDPAKEWVTGGPYAVAVETFAVQLNGTIRLPDASGDASSGPRIQTGSNAPTFAAPQGSLYLRTDGAAATTLYVNTNGSTTWSAR